MTAMPLKLQDTLIESIARRIISGEWPAGKIITEDELTRAFSVSRTVVREAVKRLTTLGMVSSRPKVGTIVRPRDEWNLLHPSVLKWLLMAEPRTLFQLAELRLVSEPLLALLAAENATEEDLVALRAVLDRLERAYADNRADLVEADLALYYAILNATHNELIINFSRQLEQALAPLHVPTTALGAMDHEDQEMMAAFLALKREIVDGILARNGERALHAFLDIRKAILERLHKIISV